MKHNKKPMNILMLDKYLTVGGVATYLKTLSQGMIERGHTIYLITAADSDNRKIINEFRSCGIQVSTIPYTQNRVTTAIRLIKHTFRFLKKNTVDIIHSHHRLANFAGIVVSKVVDVPHLITLHVFKDDHRLLTKLWKNEYITVPSQALKNHLIQNYDLNEKDIQVIHNAIDNNVEIDKNALTSLQETVFNEPGKFYIGYIGRISREKGVDTILKSIPLVKKRHRDIEFRIFGDGDELAKLKEQCKMLGFNSDKIFQGTTANVNESLSLMDVCVIPSRSESFCLFALESMRAQLPLIASNAGGIPEVVIDNETGLLINPDDPAMLAKNILKLYDDRSLMHRLAQRGRQRFEEKFPLEAFCKNYLHKYRSLI